MTQFILASASPRRKKLLKSLGIRFRVIPSGFEEPSPKRSTPVAYTRKVALAKARRVARGIDQGWVLGADTIVVCGQQIIGKPANLRDARRILSQLQATTHRVVTGVALVNASTGKYRLGHAVSFVTMRPLNSKEISRLARKNQDKAGAYAVQETRDPVVTRVKGSLTNVVGLPLELLRKLLKHIIKI